MILSHTHSFFLTQVPRVFLCKTKTKNKIDDLLTTRKDDGEAKKARLFPSRLTKFQEKRRRKKTARTYYSVYIQAFFGEVSMVEVTKYRDLAATGLGHWPSW